METMRSFQAAFAFFLGAILPLSRAFGGDGDDWPGFRGTRADGISSATGVFGEEGVRLELAWKRTLGSGYAGIAVASGRAVTAYTAGEHDVVAAFDAADGKPLWQFALGAAYRGHDGSADGPIPTPLIHGGRVFALAPRGTLFALNAETGAELWKSDLVAEHGAVKPHWGFGTSPLAAGGAIVIELGAENSMVCGFDPASGRKLWASGKDSVSYQSPVPFLQGERPSVLAVGETQLLCIDPSSGEVAWSYAHEGSGERGSVCLVPVVVPGARAPARILLKHRDDRSRLLELVPSASEKVRSVWEERSLGKSFAVPVHHAGHLYGFNGRTLTCVDAQSGAAAWRTREPGDGFPILVDGHLVVLTKEGSVHVAKASPEGYRELAGLQVFEDDDLCWTPPSFAQGRIFARSFAGIACIAVRPGSAASSAPAPALVERTEIGGTRFGKFLDELASASDKAAAIDAFLASLRELPIVEPDGRVVFLYRGTGEKVVLGGDLTGLGSKLPLERVPGTDLFYAAATLEPDARISYAFIRDFELILDPRNPRTNAIPGLDEDLDFDYETKGRELSWFSMPQWRAPRHLDPPDPARRGRIEPWKLESQALEKSIPLEVYIPFGADPQGAPLPLAIVHDGRYAREELRLADVLDNLVGKSVAPLVVAFVHEPPAFFASTEAYVRMMAEEVPTFLDSKYRISRSERDRAHIAWGIGGTSAVLCVLGSPARAGKLGVQSPFFIGVEPFLPLVKSAADVPLAIYLDWCKYDMRSTLERWGVPEAGRSLDRLFRAHGYEPKGGEAHEGAGVASLQNRLDDLLEALFPRPRR